MIRERFRDIVRTLLVAGVLFPAAGAAAGEAVEGGEAAAEREVEAKREPFSDWARIVLGRCALVAEGKVVRMFGLPVGVSVATFEIAEALFGESEPGTKILVITTDPRYFQTGDELVLFLVREKNGKRFEALDRILSGAPGSQERLRTVRRLIELEGMEEGGKRLEAFKKLLFSNLASADRWCRDNAVRELYVLTERRPEAFTPEETERIENEALARKSDVAATNLLYAAVHLEVLPSLRRAVSTDEDAAREGRGALQALLGGDGASAERVRMREDVVFQRYRAEADPFVRARIVRTAARLDRSRLYVGVMKALFDESFRVRAEAATGLSGFAAPVAARAVAEVLDDPFPEVRLAAVRTLAVIGTGEQVERLEAIADDDNEVEAIREAAESAAEAIEDR